MLALVMSMKVIVWVVLTCSSTLVAGNFGYWSVLFCQMAVCVGSTIANLIVGGQALKVRVSG